MQFREVLILGHFLFTNRNKGVLRCCLADSLKETATSTHCVSLLLVTHKAGSVYQVIFNHLELILK